MRSCLGGRVGLDMAGPHMNWGYREVDVLVFRVKVIYSSHVLGRSILSTETSS